MLNNEDLLKNKVCKFYNDRLEEYLMNKPREELLDEELRNLPLNKKSKIIKNIENMFTEFSVLNCGNLYNHACEDMNSIAEPIVGVIQGGETGKVNMARFPFVLILTTKRVYVYKSTISSTPGASVTMGLIGGLTKLFRDVSKEKNNPYIREVYSISEFVETSQIGTEYYGFGSEFVNWTLGKFFKKYTVFFIFRPMYLDLINDAVAIDEGTYDLESIDSKEVE